MQERLRALGLVKKPVTEREKQRLQQERRTDEIARLMRRHDRTKLYSRSAACGSWARVRSGELGQEATLAQVS